MVDIKGLNKARVLKALYDHAHAQRLGIPQIVPIGMATMEFYEGLMKNSRQFDYVCERVLKVNLSGDEFDENLYDRDCGVGAAQRAVDSARAEQQESERGTDKMPMDKQVENTVMKVLDFINEQPEEVRIRASMVLAYTLADTLSIYRTL